MNSTIRTALVVSLCIVGCGRVDDELTDDDLMSVEGQPGEVEMDDGDAQITSELRRCYCAQPYTCGHSTSTSYMYSKAITAMNAAGLNSGLIMQSYGDAPASVGTHCPEPGHSYSAATDFASGSSPCTRTRALRAKGFAAWYRVPPSFSRHIHAIYPGAPGLKSSLRSQVSSFLSGRNGLASNGVDTICPITSAEKAAVIRARDGSESSPSGGNCVPGGLYCGTDKVDGHRNSLYRCNSNHSASLVRACAHGCSINSGDDDSCRCVAGSNYCGGDVITGNSSTLYECGSNGVSTSVVRHCSNGCAVISGAEDRCR